MDDAQETSPANYANFQHRLMNFENPASQRSKHTKEIPEQILSGRISDQKAKEIKRIVQQTDRCCLKVKMTDPGQTGDPRKWS